MKKIFLHVILFYLGILSTYGQNKLAAADSSRYQKRKLSFEEANFVTSYYHQDGNNSAVTGGIGTEKLTDISSAFDLRLFNINKKGNKNTFTYELGIDHYTSASSDQIDPNTISSASGHDWRINPSFNWTQSNESTGNSYGFSGSFSEESDYISKGAGFNMTRLSSDKNTQFDLRLQAFLDTWKVILPVELRPEYRGPATSGLIDYHYHHSPRNSFSAALSLSQVINQRTQVLIMVEPGYQQGLLATKYQRDYFTDGSLRAENLPGSRYKLPVAVRLNYFADDRFIIRSFYRYYTDSWGIRAHTAELEIPVKFNSFFSISPFYRYNTQTGVRYFKPYGQHDPNDQFYTSDFDLSSLNSDFYGAGIHLSPVKGLFGWESLRTLDLRYGHYTRSNGLQSNIISLNLSVR
jgi:hypothetical protein